MNEIYNPYGNSFKLRGLPNNRSGLFPGKVSCVTEAAATTRTKKVKEKNRTKVLSFQQNIEPTKQKKRRFHLNRPLRNVILSIQQWWILRSVVVGRHDDFLR